MGRRPRGGRILRQPRKGAPVRVGVLEGEAELVCGEARPIPNGRLPDRSGLSWRVRIAALPGAPRGVPRFV